MSEYPEYKRTINIPLKEGCSKSEMMKHGDKYKNFIGCVDYLEKLNDLLDPRTRPFHHDTRIVITLQHDFMGGAWHLSNVEYDQFGAFQKPTDFLFPPMEANDE